MLTLAAVLAFGRLYPGAGAMMAAAGLPTQLVAMATGATGGEQPKPGDGKPQGQGGAQGQRPPQNQAQGGGRPGQPPRPVLVETAPVKSEKINSSVAAIGNGEALRSVIVVPLASGIIREMVVKTGDTVKAGDVLARLDSDAETIERDRAALSVGDFEDKMKRTEQLASSRAASQVAVSDARMQMETARLALRDAQLKLDRRAIIAPIDGKVGIIPVEVGDFVTTQTEIATIDDRSSLRVEFWVPERFASAILTGMPVEASPLSMPSAIVSGKIEAVASRVEQESRTLQVRAAIDNPDDTLRPGMSFKVNLQLPGENWPAVDPLAIQWGSSGAFVWKAEGDKAVRVGVKIIQRNSDTVLVEAALLEGDEVITEGVQSLRDGIQLRYARSGEAQPGG